MTRRILLIESLVSDDKAWRDASDSMRSEAIAMLTAVAEDFCHLPETEPTLLLSPQSCNALRSAGRLSADVRVEETKSGPTAWLRQQTNKTESFHAIMVVAPECDGALVSLLQEIQSDPWGRIRCLNLDSKVAEVFSDKRATAEWLRKHGIATPETKTVSNQRASAFLSRRTRIAEFCVLKPRHGAGSDRVNVISMSPSEFDRLGEDSHEPDGDWVLQPLIPGAACSIGLIGCGGVRPTICLPAARQDIRRQNNQFRYNGGTIPCEAPLAGAVTRVAGQVAEALGEFSGYVGIDVVVSTATNGAAAAQVIEINPRLCTSYVGYRALCEDNLAACLLQQHGGEQLRWKSVVVDFDNEGLVRVS